MGITDLLSWKNLNWYNSYTGFVISVLILTGLGLTSPTFSASNPLQPGYVETFAYDQQRSGTVLSSLDPDNFEPLEVGLLPHSNGVAYPQPMFINGNLLKNSSMSGRRYLLFGGRTIFGR